MMNHKFLHFQANQCHRQLQNANKLKIFNNYINPQPMGNVDHAGNQQLMTKHNLLNLDFFSSTPLYNVEDITFPLSTEDIKIVDATGRRVKLAGGNWSGAHMCRHTVDGLEMRPLRDIAMHIRYKFKMNCIRLTYSLQMYYDNNKVDPKYLKANPQLIGKTSMEIFDITVKTLTEVGLMVLLNNHTSSSMWCCSNSDGEGLWWTYEYPEYKFFECAEHFANRYKDNPRVIGMDLRNQLRKAYGYESSWGDGNLLTDWKRAATICGEKVLKIAPHWLIVVGGLNYQLDLTGIAQYSIQYSVPNKLVYSGHFYGFSWLIPVWNLVSYDQFKKKLFNSQTFVRALGHPFLLGQFGNNCRDIPWKYLLQYLAETDIDWTYWALDGFKCDPEKDQTYGVFTNDFKQARHPDLLEDMINAGPPKGTIIQYKPSHSSNLKNNEKMQGGQKAMGFKQQSKHGYIPDKAMAYKECKKQVVEQQFEYIPEAQVQPKQKAYIPQNTSSQIHQVYKIPQSYLLMQNQQAPQYGYQPQQQNFSGHQPQQNYSEDKSKLGSKIEPQQFSKPQWKQMQQDSSKFILSMKQQVKEELHLQEGIQKPQQLNPQKKSNAYK